ncbi:D-isomer specific 2-hydroxyacid dehydrogenase [Xylariaceae sp. FL0016]|nr:D-isomer specific 2-hydroxyacid dehydrogenase [Xylariaceae sp. FL0016]
MAGDSPTQPQQLPSSTHHVVVLLDGVHMTLDDLDTAPYSHEVLSYHRVTEPSSIRERIQCASIVVSVQSHITAESLGDAPYLKCVIVPTSGTNHVDLNECRRRGIRVANCPGPTSLGAAEHAISLYFATRRHTVRLHNEVRLTSDDGKNSWKKEGSIAYKMQTANGRAPVAIGEEVVGIIGYGIIGKRIETLCKGLGMEVMIADRRTKGASINAEASTSHRVPFDKVIQSTTALFITCPLRDETHNLIDAPEIRLMRPEVVITNMSRGAVMNSSALIQALREKSISGAAVDVYDSEPASSEKDSALLAEDTKNFVVGDFSKFVI